MSPVEAKVMVVEDADYICEAAVEALEGAGHAVLGWAGDLRTARQQLDELTVIPDLYLIDGELPEREGGSPDKYLGAYFAKLVRERFGNVVVIVMFSSRTENAFGDHRFPSAGRVKTSGIVEQELGAFVTNLPRR